MGGKGRVGPGRCACTVRRCLCLLVCCLLSLPSFPHPTLLQGDFGLTMSMRQESAISPVGTVEYMAPEVRGCAWPGRWLLGAAEGSGGGQVGAAKHACCLHHCSSLSCTPLNQPHCLPGPPLSPCAGGGPAARRPCDQRADQGHRHPAHQREGGHLGAGSDHLRARHG